MKKQHLILFLIISSLYCQSQITFEKGYYINETNQKINVLIKNLDWKNNPTEFEFKPSEDSDTERLTINSVKEFGINEVSKYLRCKVAIDRSSENIDQLSFEEDPIFKEEQLFLKVLIEGQANLYALQDANLRKYFYNLNDSTIKQLIFKRYKAPKIDDNKESTINVIRENNTYKKQLFNDLKCQSISLQYIRNVEYKRKDLVGLFEAFNECQSIDYINFDELQKRDLFNLSIRPGVNISSAEIVYAHQASRNVNFETEYSFRFGIETEFIMPFNKNKWSIIIEPTYQYYKSEEKIDPFQAATERTMSVVIDYKSIEFPFGLRYYSFINNENKLFFNFFIILDMPLSSSVVAEREDLIDLTITSKPNAAFGLGYKFKDKYGIEIRYSGNRDLLNRDLSWGSKYQSLSLIVGYTLF